MICANGIGLIVLWRLWEKYNSSIGWKKIILLILAVKLILLCGTMIRHWDQIYHYGDGHTSGQTVSLFYANMYYKNTQAEQLLQQIQTYDPDIILLVEYIKKYDAILAEGLQQEYPYASRYVGRKGYDGDMIFSKYPLEKIQHTTHPGSFSHLRVIHPKQSFDLALIHTSAPVSPQFFVMRHTQLKLLTELLTEYYSDTNQSLVLLGDFNISPWSPLYMTQLHEPLSALGMQNLTTDLSQTRYTFLFPYTWCHLQLPFICSHIDHLWTRGMTGSLQQVLIDGSDHTGFFAELSV